VIGTTTMVEAAAFPTRSDAELAQASLAAAGIRSAIAADDAGGAYPFDLSGGARLSADTANAKRMCTLRKRSNKEH
jgi:hypothetical protein